ncbi:DNA-processing protein DprA [Nocardia sp. XZ_19_385]|uniref:DNA-processing protein DprA n=1 Tax=Nocardia sp. XZ_19_385 TaxID=2769488 RepID=UPI001E5BCFAD|nr:DNA-processing protein DprA [Nocardia sp. XZ_19_385]
MSEVGEQAGPGAMAQEAGQPVHGAWLARAAGSGARMIELDAGPSGLVGCSGRSLDPSAAVPGSSSGWPSAADDERRLAWVYLSRVVEGPCAALSSLIESVGVVEAARAVRECALPESLRGPTERRRGMDCAEKDLEIVERLGGRVVTPDDPEWPAWRMLGLTQLQTGRDQDGAVPLVLWVRGPRSLLDASERALAVVGARCSTSYGHQVTRDIVSDLAVEGWTIVSGAAYGIDAMAHRAALASGAPTIAVLACGVDRPYPVDHDRLLAEIADIGLVVSEYAPGTSARKHQFLARNRLIAALADGVLVVEAGLRSGARNTVKWARRIGRPALAVPGSVNSASSVGCHHMIRDGEALLVTRAEEVIDEAGPLRLSLPGTAGTATGSADALTGDEATVFGALPKRGSRQPVELASRTDLPLPIVRAALAALELAELVGVGERGWYRLASTRNKNAR